MKIRFGAATFAAITLVFVTSLTYDASAQAPVRVLSSNGVRGVMEELLKQGEKTLGHPAIEFNTSSVVRQRIQAGESFDVAILTSEVIDDLIKAGKLTAGSRTDIARSGIGVGIRRGAAKPDIKTPEAMKATLLRAKSITYAQDGASRPHIEKMMDGLGIAQDMKPKSVLVQGVDNAVKAVMEGKAEIIITLISEIVPAAGLELVGPLPRQFQNYVSFAAAVSPNSKNQNAGEALIKFVTGPAVAPTYKAKGMETVAGIR
jgi:molybdate transport system substrate-binding protein